MYKYIITLEVPERLTPGNMEHVTELINNLNNRNYVKFEVVERTV